MAKESPKCIHCGGTLIKDDGERKCLQCGRVWKSLQERHQFYYEHRFEILKDITEIGRPASLRKWQMPSGTATQLIKQWLNEKLPLPPKTLPTAAENHLPPLPLFSNDWTSEVQITWLKVYQELKK